MTPDPFHSLEGTLDQVWQRLARGVADRRAAARHPTLATVGPEGPEMRTVVLRAARRSEAQLDVHTDVRSAKVLHIRREPRIAMHVWDAKADCQIRINALASCLSGEDGRGRFAQVPEPARRVYAGFPPPGKVLAVPEEHGETEDPANHFCVLLLDVLRIETLHLGPDRHRRAVFTAAGGWSGRWIAP